MKRLLILFLLISTVGTAFAGDEHDYTIALKNESGDIISIRRSVHALEYIAQAYPNYTIEVFPTFVEYDKVGNHLVVRADAQQPNSKFGNSYRFVKDRLDAAYYLRITAPVVGAYFEAKELGDAPAFADYSTIFRTRQNHRNLLNN